MPRHRPVFVERAKRAVPVVEGEAEVALRPDAGHFDHAGTDHPWPHCNGRAIERGASGRRRIPPLAIVPNGRQSSPASTWDGASALDSITFLRRRRAPMTDHAGGDRSALASIAFLAKLAAVFSLFAVVGSLAGTGAPDTRAVIALAVSLAVWVGIGVATARE